MLWETLVAITDADRMTPEELAELHRKFREFPVVPIEWQAVMPDDDDVATMIDWIDEVNTLTDEDPADDDDESSGTSDPMDGWDLDGEEEDVDDVDCTAAIISRFPNILKRLAE